ncbi:TraC family protein [Bradyrhizobium sp. USDA 10063]
MKKPSRQIRDEIARLQDQLKQAETREAERIGRIALKAGMGEIEEGALLSAFEEIAGRFRKGGSRTAKAAAIVAPGASSGVAEQG